MPFVVKAGDAYRDADIGFVAPNAGNIGGSVWNDVNKNGRQDAGEPGLPGVSVDLLDASGNIIATTTTDQNGNYTFPGLPPGMYSVKVSDTQNTLDDYSVGPVVLGSTADGDSKLQPYQIILGANQTNATADFGYVRTGRTNESGIIGNQVWYETDGDGIYEPGQGEQGVEGVTVELLDAQGRVVMTTTTGASGDYVFTSLIAGTYQVRVTDAFKVLDGYLVTRYPADQTSDNTNKRQPYSVIAAGRRHQDDRRLRLYPPQRHRRPRLVRHGRRRHRGCR